MGFGICAVKVGFENTVTYGNNLAANLFNLCTK